MDTVKITHEDRSYLVLDPARYPYGKDEHRPPDPVTREHWYRYGTGTTVVDVGAAFGSHTMPALAAGAHVIAVEPSRDGRRILQVNVDLNNWGPRFELHPVAVFDGGIYPSELEHDVFRERYPADDTLQYTTLDAIIAGRHVDAIKVDVEGGELGVIRGAEKTLRAHRPLLIIEDHQVGNNFHISNTYPESVRSSETIRQTLVDWGYRSVARVSWESYFYIVGIA